MQAFGLFMASLIASALAFAAPTSDPPKGVNCDLKAPPPAAGEEMNHGMVLRVFPRARDIGIEYSGCQALFGPEGTKWVVVSLTEVTNGDPTRVWSPFETDQERAACRYKQGKVIRGDPRKCPAAEFILLKSLAPGCVRAIEDAVAKQGLGAPRPSECEYQ